MAEQTMETLLYTALWRQFGAAIDMLENALVACPDALWTGRIWGDLPDHPLPPDCPPRLPEFWNIAYHTLFWLDLYLSGRPEEEFAPPAPFSLAELDPSGVPPEQPYTKEEVLGYLAATRQKCHDTLLSLTDERARRPARFPWLGGQPASYLELQLYNMRHVQEHAAQLSLFLGRHGIPDEALDWVPWAKDEPGSN